ncbi:hypothetical protein JOB18_009399 [Solea senegalensis]|uniref:Uncharacterized protein n=1 Tax=Solea senegalensis TaxID=28829 RepID=A0AAV6SKG3_SOLSE|nr:hypothetical protein JOB18_009399 [Solea senegalensis]
MEASFDFNIYDMSSPRRWWCIALVENLGLQGYGRKFAHFTKEGRATRHDNPAPVSRISRKRRHSSCTVVPSDTEDHLYSKMPCISPVQDLVSLSNSSTRDDHTVLFSLCQAYLFIQIFLYPTGKENVLFKVLNHMYSVLHIMYNLILGKGPTSPTEATRGKLSVNQCNHRGSGHAATP